MKKINSKILLVLSTVIAVLSFGIFIPVNNLKANSALEDIQFYDNRVEFHFNGSFETIKLTTTQIGVLSKYRVADLDIFYYENDSTWSYRYYIDEDITTTNIIDIEFNYSGLEIYFNGGDATLVLEDQPDTWAGKIVFNLKNVDNTRPAISGNEHFASNVDDPTPVESMVAEFKAIDDVDGDISHLIVIESDNYTKNNTKLGMYDVNLSVTDKAGNKSLFTFYVTVADITAPIVNADTSKKIISYDKTLDLNALKNTITFSDNYYSNEELTVTLTKDTYTPNKTKLGLYVVEYTISDPSLNDTIISFPIEVKDMVGPVINGIKTLEKSYTNIMTISDILEGVTANDAIDGDLTDKIIVESDNYTGNANKVGTYKIVISVSDKAGNKTTSEISIKVIDDKGANWYITNGVTLNLPKDTVMTRTQIIDLLTRAGRVKSSPLSKITYIADTYSGNETTAGIYTLAFKVQEPDGNENDYTFAVNVMGEKGTDTEQLPPKATFIDHIKTYKTYYIIGGVSIVLITIFVNKVKSEVKKNKRRR